MKSHGSSLVFAALGAALATSVPVHAASAPSGRYCGLILSGGFLEPSVTDLVTDRDGKVSGSYEFRNSGKLESGKLSEIATGVGERTRVLTWSDKFGSGRLVVTFNPEFSHFEGKWGSRNAEPNAHWSGRLCERKTSQLDRPNHLSVAANATYSRRRQTAST